MLKMFVINVTVDRVYNYFKVQVEFVIMFEEMRKSTNLCCCQENELRGKLHLEVGIVKACNNGGKERWNVNREVNRRQVQRN